MQKCLQCFYQELPVVTSLYSKGLQVVILKKPTLIQNISMRNYKNEINSNCKHDLEKSEQKISLIHWDIYIKVKKERKKNSVVNLTPVTLAV